MIKVQTILFVLAIAGLASASQVITFTCESVGSGVCASGYRYRTQGKYETVTLNSSYCVPVGSSCTPTTKQFNLQTCKIDYKNAACSTGVCFMIPQVQVCTKDNTCASPYYANFKCDACTSNVQTCAKCFFKTTNQTSNDTTTSTCLGANCTQGLATATTNIGPCSGGFDALGQKCSCCVTTVQVSRFCTTNSEALQQSDVTTWFNKVQGNTKFGSKMQVVVGAIVLGLIAMIY